MKAFTVWVGRMDGAAGVRVDGMENTQWLLRRLSDFFVFKTSEPLREVVNSSQCTFRVAHNSNMSVGGFEKLLAGIPEVNLIVERVPKVSEVNGAQMRGELGQFARAGWAAHFDMV